MARKQRADAKLKTLPPLVQSQIYELCQTMGYYAVRSTVREKFKVETSTGALSEFYAWYPIKRRLEEAEHFAKDLKENLSSLATLNLDAEKLSQIAQVAFETQAMKEQNPDLYIGLKKLRQKDRAADLDERRIALLEKKAAQADEAQKVARNTSLSKEEQLAQYRQIFGG